MLKRKKKRIKDLEPKVGSLIPIYLDYKNQLKFEGFAKLIRKEPQISLTFFADNEEFSEEWHPNIYVAERWLVEFTSWQKTIFRTHRWIRRLVRPATRIRKGGDSVMSLYTTYDQNIEEEILPETDFWE
jgi:hypothetical protein